MDLVPLVANESLKVGGIAQNALKLEVDLYLNWNELRLLFTLKMTWFGLAKVLECPAKEGPP